MFAILHEAGRTGLDLDDWNRQARAAGLGTKRKADLYDLRGALGSKGLVHHHGDRWYAKHSH